MSQKPQRAIKRAVAAGRDDYDLHDQEWQRIGLSAPARRALVDAKLYKVSDLRRVSLAELTALHGMGKSAIARIKVIMEAKRINFR